MKELDSTKLLYDTFINNQDNKAFLIGFIDYFEHIKSQPILYELLEKELEIGREKEEFCSSYRKEAEDEFKATFEYIKKTVKKLSISDESVIQNINHIDDVLNY
jgi:hypothetical protein